MNKNESSKVEPRTLGEFNGFGIYSVFFLLVSELMLLPEMLNMTFMIYGGLAPKISSCERQNLTHLSKNEACSVVSTLINETGCVPELIADFQSLGYEFKKYCGADVVELKTAISILMTGALIGSAIVGQLSDMFGRKQMLLFTHAGMLIFDFFAARVGNLRGFVLVQVFSMFFTGGHLAIFNVYLIENIPNKHRLWITCLLTYSPNYVIASGIAYYAGNWRTLLQIASALNIPAFCLLMIIFESPRWLIQKGRLNEARTVLQRIDRINRTQTEERLKRLEELVEEEKRAAETSKRKRRYFFYHLFYSIKSTTYIFMISYSLACASLVTYATVFNLEYIAGSVYLNAALYGLFRCSVNILSGLLDFWVPKLGRKSIKSIVLGAILIMLSLVTISKLLSWNHPTIVRLCVLLSASLVSQLYVMNAVILSELFPTAIRNVAAGFVQVSNRIGGILAPHLFYLSSFWDPLPYFILLLFIATNLALFTTFIPETKNRPFVDHLPEKKKKSKSHESTDI